MAQVRLEDVLLARVVDVGVVVGPAAVVVEGMVARRDRAGAADGDERVAVLAVGLLGPAAVALAGGEPSALAEEGFDGGGVDGDDPDELGPVRLGTT